jgi:hypothetical protein
VRRPELAASLLTQGTLVEGSWPELGEEAFAEDVRRRLAEVGLTLVKANGHWLARAADRGEHEGFEPMFEPNDGHMAVLACLWLHLRYLPRLRGELDDKHDEPSISVEEIEHAFSGYPPRYVGIVLGYLKNTRFIRQWNERIFAGPYLAAIDEEAADVLAREALRDFKLRRYLRRRAEELLGDGAEEDRRADNEGSDDADGDDRASATEWSDAAD